MSNSWRRISGIAGVAYVVLFVALTITIVSADPPGSSASAAEFRQWFEDNELTVGLQTWAGPLVFGVFFLLFASGLRSVLGSADIRNEGVWARLSFAGALLTVSTALGGLAFWAVLAQDEVLAVASDGTVKTLAAFDTIIFFAIINWAQALFVLGASVVIIQTGVMAKWIAWLGGVVVLLLVVSALWPFTGDDEGFLGALGFPAVIGFGVWVLGVAVSMIRSSSESGPAVTTSG